MADQTLADMRDRIVDELQRPDLEDQITNAITEASDFYRMDPFFRSDKVDASQSTVANVQIYAAPTGCMEIRDLFITDGSTRYPLLNISLGELLTLDSDQSTPVTGPPVRYANDNDISGWQVYFYPRPDAAYVITYNFVYAVPAPVLDNDSNFWTTDARVMIRAFAKYYLKMNVLNDPQGAMQDKAVADDQFRRLKQETGQRLFTGRVRSSW